MSAVWTSLGVAIVALAAILVFILQNPASVELSFLTFRVLFAMMLGAVIVLACGAARIFQHRSVARRARRSKAGAAATIGVTIPVADSVTAGV